MTIRPMTPDEHREFIRAGEVLEVAERVRLRATNRLIEHARDTFRDFRYLTPGERSAWVVGEIVSFATEVNAAYLEQRANMVNHRLSGDDVTAIWSQAHWAIYEHHLTDWRRDADNDAAWQAFERYPDQLTDTIRKRLDAAPKRPAKPRADLPVGCPLLPTVDAPRTWWELLGEFLRTRRGRRHESEASDGVR